MEIVTFLIDFILHIDKHLAEFVQLHGAWVYGLLFLIVFVETGLVVMPFLPGDSLLFMVGALAAGGAMSLPVAMGVLWNDSVSYLFHAPPGIEASRGLAFAITLCGASIAVAIFPLMGSWLIGQYGWQRAAPIQAACRARSQRPAPMQVPQLTGWSW